VIKLWSKITGRRGGACRIHERDEKYSGNIFLKIFRK
jgi:hypothetical protein